MKKRSKISLDEFEAFKGEKEKPLVKWIIIIDLSFLTLSLIVMWIAEGVFKLGIVEWSHYLILFGSNLLFFSFLYISLLKDYKVWLFKYLFSMFAPAILTLWIYFTDPEYTKILFGIASTIVLLFALLFYDFSAVILYTFFSTICLGGLFLYYSKIGVRFSLYEISLVYIFLFVTTGICFPLLQRIRLFLIELLDKRRELEEEKASLQIKVKARTKELEELNKSLDQKVKERTKALEERIGELEAFHKLTIGRELKMADLKEEIKNKEKEIEKLKKELEKKKK